MKFFGFVVWLAYSESLVKFVLCIDIFKILPKKEYALVVRPLVTGYEFAPVDTTSSGQLNQYISRYEDKKLYYLCPHSEDHTLLKIKKRVNAKYNKEKQICKYAVEPSILKVKDYLENYQREFIFIQKYDIGFKIDNKNNFMGVLKTNYESLDKNYYFLPMISVYTYADWKLTFAVTYDIITTDVKKNLENFASTYKSTELFPDKIEQFYKNQKPKLRAKLGLHYDTEKHILELGSLVNENDFIVDRWKKTARFKINQILIWKNNIEIWRNIQEYARHVGALNNSETTMTAGIGEVLTITDTKGQEHIMKWEEGEDTIFIPSLYWLAIKYYENQETTGMVIIMHNDLVYGENVRNICNKNPCIEKNIWIMEENHDQLKNIVYCCQLNAEVLEKLGIAFIHEELGFYKGDSNYLFPKRWKKDVEKSYVNDENASP